jgi:hypothetical protein
MPGHVRSLDRRRIRLNEPLLAHVEYLARLAGVSPDDIVNFVLTEVLEVGDPPLSMPAAARRPPRRPDRPADIIPIVSHRASARQAFDGPQQCEACCAACQSAVVRGLSVEHPTAGDGCDTSQEAGPRARRTLRGARPHP